MFPAPHQIQQAIHHRMAGLRRDARRARLRRGPRRPWAAARDRAEARGRGRAGRSPRARPVLQTQHRSDRTSTSWL